MGRIQSTVEMTDPAPAQAITQYLGLGGTTTSTPEVCPTPLPSMSSAQALVDGIPGALPRVLAHTFGRACIIGAGLFISGFRGKDLMRGSIAGAAAIETFVVLYLKFNPKEPPK